jgi:hypothetical protein
MGKGVAVGQFAEVRNFKKSGVTLSFLLEMLDAYHHGSSSSLVLAKSRSREYLQLKMSPSLGH